MDIKNLTRLKSMLIIFSLMQTLQKLTSIHFKIFFNKILFLAVLLAL